MIMSALHVDRTKQRGRVIVCLSGGIDSTTLATMALREGRLAACIVYRYAQPHMEAELRMATEWCRANGVLRMLVDIDLDGRRMALGPAKQGSRVVPGRNMLMLSHAIAIAASAGGEPVREVWYGPTRDDRADYADCTPEFVEAMDRLGAYSGVSVRAPLIDMTKREVVALARQLGVDLDMTWSCYEPTWRGWQPVPCGGCNACRLRDAALA